MSSARCVKLWELLSRKMKEPTQVDIGQWRIPDLDGWTYYLQQAKSKSSGSSTADCKTITESKDNLESKNNSETKNCKTQSDRKTKTYSDLVYLAIEFPHLSDILIFCSEMVDAQLSRWKPFGIEWVDRNDDRSNSGGASIAGRKPEEQELSPADETAFQTHSTNSLVLSRNYLTFRLRASTLTADAVDFLSRLRSILLQMPIVKFLKDEDSIPNVDIETFQTLPPRQSPPISLSNSPLFSYRFATRPEAVYVLRTEIAVHVMVSIHFDDEFEATLARLGCHELQVAHRTQAGLTQAGLEALNGLSCVFFPSVRNTAGEIITGGGMDGSRLDGSENSRLENSRLTDNHNRSIDSSRILEQNRSTDQNMSRVNLIMPDSREKAEVAEIMPPIFANFVDPRAIVARDWVNAKLKAKLDNEKKNQKDQMGNEDKDDPLPSINQYHIFPNEQLSNEEIDLLHEYLGNVFPACGFVCYTLKREFNVESEMQVEDDPIMAKTNQGTNQPCGKPEPARPKIERSASFKETYGSFSSAGSFVEDTGQNAENRAWALAECIVGGRNMLALSIKSGKSGLYTKMRTQVQKLQGGIQFGD